MNCRDTMHRISRLTACAALLMGIAWCSSTSAEEERLWSSVDGKRSVSGLLTEIRRDEKGRIVNVLLQTQTDGSLSIGYDNLSKQDQIYLQERHPESLDFAFRTWWSPHGVPAWAGTWSQDNATWLIAPRWLQEGAELRVTVDGEEYLGEGVHCSNGCCLNVKFQHRLHEGRWVELTTAVTGTIARIDDPRRVQLKSLRTADDVPANSPAGRLMHSLQSRPYMKQESGDLTALLIDHTKSDLPRWTQYSMTTEDGIVMRFRAGRTGVMPIVQLAAASMEFERADQRGEIGSFAGTAYRSSDGAIHFIAANERQGGIWRDVSSSFGMSFHLENRTFEVESKGTLAKLIGKGGSIASITTSSIRPQLPLVKHVRWETVQKQTSPTRGATKVEAVKEAHQRAWQDKTGQHTTIAKLSQVGLDGIQAFGILEKRDGSQIKVMATDLCREDQQEIDALANIRLQTKFHISKVAGFRGKVAIIEAIPLLPEDHPRLYPIGKEVPLQYEYYPWLGRIAEVKGGKMLFIDERKGAVELQLRDIAHLVAGERQFRAANGFFEYVKPAPRPPAIPDDTPSLVSDVDLGIVLAAAAVGLAFLAKKALESSMDRIDNAPPNTTIAATDSPRPTRPDKTAKGSDYFNVKVRLVGGGKHRRLKLTFASGIDGRKREGFTDDTERAELKQVPRGRFHLWLDKQTEPIWTGEISQDLELRFRLEQGRWVPTR